MGGTPLNEALICLHQILPQFKKENKLQKVQCVILSDGEAAQMPIYKEFKDYRDDEVHFGTRHYQPETSYLRNRKTDILTNFHMHIMVLLMFFLKI